jgi:hypothetical protein
MERSEPTLYFVAHTCVSLNRCGQIHSAAIKDTAHSHLTSPPPPPLLFQPSSPPSPPPFPPKAWPIALSGRDVIVVAKTGRSDHTNTLQNNSRNPLHSPHISAAAKLSVFFCPLSTGFNKPKATPPPPHTHSHNPPPLRSSSRSTVGGFKPTIRAPPSILVLAPTRELACQIEQEVPPLPATAAPSTTNPPPPLPGPKVRQVLRHTLSHVLWRCPQSAANKTD